MNTNSKATVKKLIQVTEEAQPPMHMPIVIGNECYIVTEQDVRRIEDTRLLSYSKLTASGELVSIDVLSHDGQAIMNACRYRMQIEQNANNNNINNGATTTATDATNAALAELFARACGGKMMEAAAGGVTQMQTQPVATLEQQLQWAKTTNTSAPYPMTYTSATSTSEIPVSARAVRFQADGAKCCSCCCCSCRNNCSSASCTNRGCNTMDVDDETLKNTDGKSDVGGGGLGARAQLKQKKALNCIF